MPGFGTWMPSPGERDPPSGASGAGVSELGHVWVPEEPFVGGRVPPAGGTRRCTRGAGLPRRTTKGSSQPSFGEGGRTQSRDGRPAWKGGQCPTSRTQEPMSCCPGLCTSPSSAGISYHCSSNPRRNMGAGDGPTRGWSTREPQPPRASQHP